jgi:Ca2+-binding EF-hand superfamily protein
MMEDASFMDSVSLTSSQAADQNQNISTNWDDDDDDEEEEEEEDEEEDETDTLAAESNEITDFNDDETFLSQKTSKSAKSESTAPLLVFDFILKPPLPPCCISEACLAYDVTHLTPTEIPYWIQESWDKAEAEKLAGLYGGSGEQAAAESEDEEDEGDHIDFDKELDFGPNKMSARYLPKLLEACGEDMTSKETKRLARHLDTDKSGGITFLSFIAWMYRLKLSRKNWGGRICITDDAPLPRCCSNPACKAHLERPTAADDDEEEEKQHHIMWSVFARHDDDGSGELSLDEVRAIMEDHGIQFDEHKLVTTFDKYDLDHSHMLEFEEFCSLMDDLDAKNQIVQKRRDAYALPDHMQGWFGPVKLEDFKTQFGMFDDNGDGTVDGNELRAVLRALGTELSHDQVVELIATIDNDKSGVIEFPEFITLMRKIERGEIDVGDSG